MMTRRNLIRGSAAAATAQTVRMAPPHDIALASSNGIACCEKVVELLRAGGDTLDAVIAGVTIVEEDPEDTSVGYGGLPNEDGVVELDACVMHGPTRRAGSVGALHSVKTPSRVAKLVMERTDHVMLVGEGALRFAKAHGFKEENLLTEKARQAWLMWKESRGGDWGPGQDAPQNQAAAELPPKRGAGVKLEWRTWVREVIQNPPTGTISCLAINRKGEMSGCTTTSGLAWKIPGRVGDSPIIGAGLYVDQDVGAAGSTGRGEENIRIAGAHTVVENMRRGMTPEEACLDALRRVSRNYEDDEARLDFGLKFYALRKDGRYGAASLWSHSRPSGDRKAQRQTFVVNEGSESKKVETAYLYERR